MKVFSAFNGIAVGYVALERAGIRVTSYKTSEVDKYALELCRNKYPDHIELGDINHITPDMVGDVDLMLAGSPCQDLSRTRKGDGLKGSQSGLFYKFYELWKELKPRYFMLENVRMSKESENIISELLGVEPVLINSNMFSAQDRERLYWVGGFKIPPIRQSACPQILRDIVVPTHKVPDKYWFDAPFTYHGSDAKVQATLHIAGHDILKRVNNLNNTCPTLTKVSGGSQQKKVFQDGRCRKLMPIEYERLQNLVDDYTAGFSDTQRYNMCGNGWTADVIAHIISPLRKASQT